jgi:hypothetical protein
MSNSFALWEFTIPPRRETRSPLGFSDKSAKKSRNFRCYAQKPSILPGVVLRAGILHAPCQKSANSNLQMWFLSPTGRLNFGFILRENLLVCSTYLPLGVFQLVLWDIRGRRPWERRGGGAATGHGSGLGLLDLAGLARVSLRVAYIYRWRWVNFHKVEGFICKTTETESPIGWTVAIASGCPKGLNSAFSHVLPFRTREMGKRGKSGKLSMHTRPRLVLWLKLKKCIHLKHSNKGSIFYTKLLYLMSTNII